MQSSIIKSGLFAETFFLGIFILFVYTGLFRSVMSSTGGSEFMIPAIAVPVVFIASLTSALLLFSRKAKRSAGVEFFYVLSGYMLSVFALLLLLLICVSSTADIRRNLMFPSSASLLFLICLLASAIAGASTGLLYGTFFSRGVSYVENQKIVYGTVSGFLIGAILIQLFSFLPFQGTFFYPIGFGLFFLFLVLVNGTGKLNLSVLKKGTVLFLFFFFLAAFAAGIFLMIREKPERFFRNSMDSSVGKYEFSDYGIFFNGKMRKFYEYSPDFDKMLVLISSLQNNRSGQKSFIITNADTWLVFCTNMMPHIEKADALVPDSIVASATLSSVLRSGKVKLHTADPVEFLKNKKKKYDLFIIGISEVYSLGMHRYYMLETIRAAEQSLVPDGVFAMRLPNPPGYSPEAVDELRSNIVQTVKKVFRNVLFSSGRTGILIASNGNHLTFSPNVLEKRLEKFSGGRKIAPPGLFYIVGNALIADVAKADFEKWKPLPETEEFNPELIKLSWRNNPFFSGGQFSVPLKGYDFLLRYYLFFLAGAFLLYMSLRYFLSVSLDAKMLFTSFENGFYTLGTVSLLLFLFQIKTGSLYLNLPYMIGIFSAGVIGGGILAGRFRSGRFLFLISGLLPVGMVLASMLSSSGAFLSLFTAAFLTGLCGGYAYFEFRRKSSDGQLPIFIPSLTLFGCSAGIFAVTALLLPAGGIVACVTILCLSRLSRIING